LLLLLRCTVLGLLAFGFARPFLKQNEVASPVSTRIGHTIILLDSSASMRRSGVWQQARDKAVAAVRQLPPGSLAAVYSFDRRVNSLLSFDEWRQAPLDQRLPLAREKLEALQPGWGSTQAGQALMRAAELLADAGARSAPGSSEIVLITDLQEGARLDAMQGYEWPRNVRIRVETVSPPKNNNASLALLAPAADAATTNTGYRLRVSNAPESNRDQFQLGWVRGGSDQFANPPLDLHLPPGQSRTVPIPAASTPDLMRLVLRGDDEPFDNSVVIAPNDPVRARVLYVGSEPETEVRGELYFLRRALQDTRTRQIDLVTNQPSVTLTEEMPRGVTMVIVSEPLEPAAARALHDLLTQGRTVLVTVGQPQMAGTISTLLGPAAKVEAEEALVQNFALWADIDYRHPLFAPFSDPRFADFSRVRFWKYRKLDFSGAPGTQVIARFDSGDPALTQSIVGKGRLLVLASSWRTTDSQLALSTKFVPLLYTMLEQSGAPLPPPPEFYVGDPIPLNSLVDQPGETTVTRPGGAEERLKPGISVLVNTSDPGVYSVRSGTAQARFVVNPDPAESRLTPLSLDELERLGAPLVSAAETVAAEAARRERLRNSELENRQKIWRWLIIGALAVLLVETWLAGRASRPAAANLGRAQA
jgi:hypothetical protein